jgi:cold shock CspA family protein
MTGVVIRVLPNKGFCFIRGEDGLSRFVHAREFQPPEAFDKTYEGQKVEFTPAEGPPEKGNGLRAENVRPCANP